jgi:hypothetical protein
VLERSRERKFSLFAYAAVTDDLPITLLRNLPAAFMMAGTFAITAVAGVDEIVHNRRRRRRRNDDNATTG